MSVTELRLGRQSPLTAAAWRLGGGWSRPGAGLGAASPHAPSHPAPFPSPRRREHRRPRWPVVPVWCLPPKPVYGYKASSFGGCAQQGSRAGLPAGRCAAAPGARWPPAAAAPPHSSLPPSPPLLKQDEFICRPDREYGWDGKPVFGEPRLACCCCCDPPQQRRRHRSAAATVFRPLRAAPLPGDPADPAAASFVCPPAGYWRDEVVVYEDTTCKTCYWVGGGRGGRLSLQRRPPHCSRTAPADAARRALSPRRPWHRCRRVPPALTHRPPPSPRAVAPTQGGQSDFDFSWKPDYGYAGNDWGYGGERLACLALLALAGCRMACACPPPAVPPPAGGHARAPWLQAAGCALPSH